MSDQSKNFAFSSQPQATGLLYNFIKKEKSQKLIKS